MKWVLRVAIVLVCILLFTAAIILHGVPTITLWEEFIVRSWAVVLFLAGIVGMRSLE